uniref:Cytochrome c oxidase subunit 2 n=1 Tax=Euciroa cf. queenslandica STW-2017 TaxID=1969321 RepID=A0A1U9XPF2_9BIVA|nr:cytochrome c oxidase subunit II [Euciroa cf. queenslandica STW-2017]AQZ26126.1 cytochrome c oxidase subunit II [Euciroa cf. queenslandica STW-2017]
MARWGQIGMEDASSPYMLDLLDFHDLAMCVLVMIMLMVCFFMMSGVLSPFYYRTYPESQTLEAAWSIFPIVCLVLLGWPSVYNLYKMDQFMTGEYLIKVIGRQWLWVYEYPIIKDSEVSNISFESYMVPTEYISMGEYRLLEADKRLVLPVNQIWRVLVTSDDVLHCWTVLGLGLKVDGAPGRLNQILFNALRCGVYYGQCSEICGANHSFMPINVEIVPISFFDMWIKSIVNSE